MKKKNIIVLVIVFLIIICVGLILYKNREEEKKSENSQERYNEIIESLEAGIEWHLNAAYPKGCEYDGDVRYNHSERLSSTFLINNGFIKKEDMLDIDKKSYCKGYANTECGDGEDIVYKIYLKCKDFTTKGYVEYGD